jgi:hypothetical protein
MKGVTSGSCPFWTPVTFADESMEDMDVEEL